MLVNTVGVFIGFLSLFLGGLALKENGLDMIIKRLFKEDEIPKNLVKIMNMVVTEAKPAAYLLILVGSLVFVISILGCCGVCCNKLKFMRIYVLLFSIIVVLLAVVIGFTAWQSTKAIKIMVAGGKFLLLNFHKRLNRDVFNGVQKYAKCCGVMQPGDYLESVKYQAYLHQKLLARKSNWDKINNGTDYFELNHGSNPVPDSCCRSPTGYCGVSNNFTGVEVPEHISKYDDPEIFEEIKTWLSSFFKNKADKDESENEEVYYNINGTYLNASYVDDIATQLDVPSIDDHIYWNTAPISYEETLANKFHDMNITGSEKYMYANETYYTETEWDMYYGNASNDVVFVDFFGNLRNDTDVYKSESFFYDINGQKFNGTYVDVLDDQFNSGNVLEVFDVKMEWDAENGGYKDYGYFGDYGDMGDYDGLQSEYGPDMGYEYDYDSNAPGTAPTYRASPSSAESSRQAAYDKHRDGLQIAGIHQGIRKRRETDPNNDYDAEEEEEEDFDETGGYDESILEGHTIHPLGCGHKAIIGALKHRNRLLGFLCALLVPYLLAFIAACTHLSSLKREHTYEVEECEEQVTVMPVAVMPNGMVQIVNNNVNKN